MEDEERQRGQQELVGKNVAYYQTFLSAWVTSRMEKDKQILTLAAAGIGLLAAFLHAVPNYLVLVLWLFAVAAFLAAVVLVLDIFKANSDYIVLLLRDHPLEDQKDYIQKAEDQLRRNTIWAYRLFIVGATLTAVVAIYDPIVALSMKE